MMGRLYQRLRSGLTKHSRHLPRFTWSRKIIFLTVGSFIIAAAVISIYLFRGNGASAAWYNTAWSHRKMLTINSNMVSGVTALTNFPVLVSLNDPLLSQFAQADGDDILFTDVNGTQLDHDIESFDQGSGNLVAWVEFPTLNPENDTIFYMYFGNSAASNQEDVTGTWNSNYRAVYHMAEDPSISTDGDCGGGTAEFCDSTSNNTDGDSVGSMTSADQLTGRINGAIDFDGANDRLQVAHTASLAVESGSFTVSGWFRADKLPNDPTAANVKFLNKMDDSGNAATCTGWDMSAHQSTNNMRFRICNGSSYVEAQSNSAMLRGEWMYLVGRYDSVADTVTFYVNGIQQTDQESSISPVANTDVLTIADYKSNVQPFDGIADEVRISAAAHTSDWILTEYNNQSTPQEFIRIGQSYTQDEQRQPIAYWKMDSKHIVAASDWFDTDWSNRKRITIDADQVSGSSDFTNFPILVNLASDSELSSKAQSDGDDILFTDMSGIQLDHEIESYTTGSGALVAWVRIPTLSGITDTSIYMYYGNSIVGSQQNPTGVWDSNYRAVWHLNNTSGAILDSTSNNNDSTTVNVTTQGSATGKIGGATDVYDGGEIIFPDTNSLDISGDFTVQAWVRPDTIAASNYSSIVYKGGAPNYYLELYDSNEYLGGYHSSVGVWTDYTSTTSPITTGNFHFLSVTHSASGDIVSIYRNGVLTGSNTSATGTPNVNTSTVTLAENAYAETFDGIIDEVRIISAARSADWLATEYANHNTPSSFYVLSEEQDPFSGYTIHDSATGVHEGLSTEVIWQDGDLCAHNSCLAFNGSSSTVGIGTTVNNINSIAFWAKPITATEYFIGINGSASVQSSSGTISATGFTAPTIYVNGVVSSTIPTHRWSHVVVTTGTALTGSSMTLGQIASNYLQGSLDEVKVFDFVLSADQVKAEYNSRGVSAGVAARFGSGDAQNISISDGLVAYYAMNEKSEDSCAGGQDMCDSTGNGQHATATGTTVGSQGKFGRGRDFSGTTGNFVSATESTLGTMSEMTISLWVNPDTLDDYDVIFSQGEIATNNLSFLVNTSTSDLLRFDWSSDGTTYLSTTSTNPLSLDEWSHIGIVFDGSTVRLYLNGALDREESVGALTTIYNSSAAVLFGQRAAYTTSRLFDGTLDETRIYTRALSQSEIQALYQYVAHPVAYYPMDEGQGIVRVVDATSHGNDLTMNNFMDSNWHNGKYGKALYFNGSDQYVTREYDSDFDFGTYDFTVSGWFKRNTEPIGVTISNRVAASADDAEQNLTNNSVNITSSDLELIADGATNQEVGMRFTNIALAQGSSILSSYIQFTADGTSTGTSNLTVHGEDSDDAAAFVASASNITSRTKTTASVAWSSVADWNTNNEAGTNQRTPDIASVIQEIVDRPGWSSGNDIATIVTGTGVRRAYAYNGSSIRAPELQITYDAASDTQYLISRYDSDQGFKIWINSSNQLNFGIDDDSTWGSDDVATSTSTFTTNTWHHFTAQRTSTGIYLYIDGQLEGSDESLSATGTLSSDSAPLTFGSDEPTNGNYFAGWLDDIRIYDYARSVEEITQDLNAGHPAVGTPVGSTVLHLKFDEGYGTVAHDSSPEGYNGTFASGSSAPTWTNDGKFGKALTFDGNDSINNANSPNLTDGFTLSAWVKSADFTTSMYVLEVFAGKPVLHVSSDLVRITMRDAGNTTWNTYSSSAVLQDNQWNYIAATYDGSNVRLYHNGLQVGTGTHTGPMGGWSSTDDIQVGGRSTVFFNGQIDEPKMYQFALTADQIKLDMNQGKAMVLGAGSTGVGGTTPSNSAAREYCVPGDSATCSAPVLHYTYNQRTDNTCSATADVCDSSGNGFHAVNTNMESTDWTNGKYAGALQYGGTDEYSLYDDTGASALDISGSWTVQSWVRFDTLNTTYTPLVYKGSTSTNNANYVVQTRSSPNQDEIRCQYINGSGDWQLVDSANADLTTNRWYHIACIYNSSANTISLYIDGRYNNSASTTGAPTTGDFDFFIGRGDTAFGGDYHRGLMDETIVYNYPRTQAQLSWDYNRGAPVAHYKLDECQGTTAYNSALNADGTSAGSHGAITIGASGENTVGNCNTSSTAWGDGADGAVNSGISLDGIDDHVTVTQGSTINWYASGDVSLSVWARIPSAATQNLAFVTKRDSGGSGLYFGSQSTSTVLIYGGGWGGSAAHTFPVSIRDDIWHHLTMVRSGGIIMLYLDGRSISPSSGGTGATAAINNSEDLLIGMDAQISDRMIGDIDDVRIYNYALTSEQVKQIMTNGAVSFK